MPTREPAMNDDANPAAGAGATDSTGGEVPLADQPIPHQPAAARPGLRLRRALVVKSLAEAAFVFALLAQFAYTHFRPGVRGSVESADARAVAGWALDESAPGAAPELQLFIDGHFAAHSRADLPPSAAAGRTAGARGFAFEVPRLPARAAEYEARVFALRPGDERRRATLRQIGEPAHFRVGADAGSVGAPEHWWDGSGAR